MSQILLKHFAIKIFYLEQELSRTTTNLGIFSKIIGNKFKEKSRETLTKT